MNNRIEPFEFRLLCKECGSPELAKIEGHEVYECQNCFHPHSFDELSRVMLMRSQTIEEYDKFAHTHMGKIEIVSNKEHSEPPLMGYEVQVFMDGKHLPFLQEVNVEIAARKVAVVKLTMLPRDLTMTLDGVSVVVKESVDDE